MAGPTLTTDRDFMSGDAEAPLDDALAQALALAGAQATLENLAGVFFPAGLGVQESAAGNHRSTHFDTDFPGVDAIKEEYFASAGRDA